ncbi:AraC family transcriptional regulator [Streptomyces sp. NPDC085946]|uniref:AraC family transcriptional regulator n=1 Tax=Streptomyces sp. NPDC085946 TaxID=3365744 RepID=UPI0037D1A80D
MTAPAAPGVAGDGGAATAGPPAVVDLGCLRMLAALPDGGPGEALYVGLHVPGPPDPGRAGTAARTAPGDLVLCSPDRRHLPRPGDGCRMVFFGVPRRFLGVPEPELERVLGTRVPGGEGLGALVSGFLAALAAEPEFHRSALGERLARGAVDLLAVLVGELLPADGPASRRPADGGMPARIRAFVEEHLPDPDLSPETIARAHHISVRHLHQLFHDDGTTVGRWVRQRRLDACRRELARPGRRTAVAAVAHRWGFTSPSHFSRSFREAYGMSPSQWRAAAAGGRTA